VDVVGAQSALFGSEVQKILEKHPSRKLRRAYAYRTHFQSDRVLNDRADAYSIQILRKQVFVLLDLRMAAPDTLKLIQFPFEVRLSDPRYGDAFVPDFIPAPALLGTGSFPSYLEAPIEFEGNTTLRIEIRFPEEIPPEQLYTPVISAHGVALL